jgi:outer membrane receptor protein involved in Fe transport
MVAKRVWSLALGFWIGIAGLAAAQGIGTIEGKVSRPDGSGLGGVTVRIDALDRLTLTDAEGAYRLGDLPSGSYEVSFRLGDHAATESGVAVAAGSAKKLDKTVDWDVSFAETITVVSASRRQERVVDAPAAVTVIPEIEIEAKSATGQIPKLLEFTPGVDFTQSGLYDFNFNTRGFNSSLNRRILTLIDGRDPSVPFLGAQEWAAVSFPMDELATVELVRGPGSALYGANAFNGVLNMTTRAPRGSEGGKVRATLGELNTQRADVRYAQEVGGGWYGKLMGGYQHSDDFTEPRNTKVEYSTFCTSASQTNCLRREARGLALDKVKIGFGGLRLDKWFEDNRVLTLEGGTASLEGPVFVTGIGRVQVTDVKRPWGRFNFNTLHWNLLSYYDTRNAKDQIALASGAHLFEDSSNLHGELQGNTPFANGRGFLVGGLAYHQQKIDTANGAGVQTLMAAKRDEHQQAVFGQLEWTLGPNLKAVVAARYDDSTLHDAQVSPKGSLVWSFGGNNTLRVTYNKAFQVPNYSEFFLRAPAGAPITAFAPLEDQLAPLLGGRTLGLRSIPLLAFGNDTMDVEKITSYEAGYSGIYAGKVYLTLDYYKSRIKNFVTDLLPGVNPNLAPYTPPSFLPASVAATVLATLRGGLGANFAGLTTINGLPALVFSYTNAGVVDTQGIDLAVNYYVSDRWLADVSYSWFDFTVKEKNERDQLLPNAPENKLSGGVTYNANRLSTSVKYRWVDAFPWAAGVFVGNVPSYGLVDLDMTWHVNDRWQVGVDVSNLLDKKHWQSFGGDLLKRRALAHVTFGW